MNLKIKKIISILLHQIEIVGGDLILKVCFKLYVFKKNLFMIIYNVTFFFIKVVMILCETISIAV